MDPYLQPTDIVDWGHPFVRRRARRLAADSDGSVTDLARRCYEWVRDGIPHSFDLADPSDVTCTASEVLMGGSGICYAKAHLLAALLRANGIPCGFCYQRLRDDAPGRFVLHGLNAVRLPGHGWYRIDPRGNKPGVEAQFAPPRERLAFPVTHDGEEDGHHVFAEPWPEVVKALRGSACLDDLRANLPDGSVFRAVQDGSGSRLPRPQPRPMEM